MTFKLSERIMETSTTTGTGAFSLLGAYDNSYVTFSTLLSAGDTTYYEALDVSTGQWEVGIATMQSNSTLSRTVLNNYLGSSAPVPFGVGVRKIFCTQPASKTMTPDFGTSQFANYSSTLGGAGEVIYSSNTTLTSANAGQVVTFYGLINSTFTLPMSNTGAPYKMPIIIRNASLTYTVTVNPQNTDSIDLTTQNNTLYPLQNMALLNDGVGNWHHLWNDAGTRQPFSVGTPTASNHAVSYGSLVSPPPIGTTTPNNGSFSTLTATTVSTGGTNNTGVDFQSSVTTVPTTGNTVPLTKVASWHVIAPTGSLAALTLTIPSAPSGVPAGQIQPLTVFFSQAVTTVTWSGTYIGPTLPTTITQGQSVRFIYNQNLAGWFHTTQV